MRRNDGRYQRFMRLFLAPTVFALAVAGGIMMATDTFLHRFAADAFLTYSDRSVTDWPDRLVEDVPILEREVRSGKVNYDTVGQLMAAIRGSAIRKLMMFDRSGRRLFTVEEDGTATVSASRAINYLALRVVQTGEPSMSRESPFAGERIIRNRVTAYLPATSPSGDIFGAIEIHYDVADFVTVIHDVLHNFSAYLIIGSGLAYLAPTLILIARNNQVRNRDMELLRLSLWDPLTGALNRHAFSEESAALFDMRKRNKNAIGVLFIDVDHFKTVNDDRGHEFGDRLLTRIASLTLGCARSGDVVGRVGGDEFVLLMKNPNREEVEAVAQLIVESVARPFRSSGTTLTPSVSVGAHLSPAGEDEKAAMHAADLALYRAKKDGRGRMAWYHASLDQSLQRRKKIETALRRGLSQDGFFIEYQPIFGNEGHDIAGFEALLRLHDLDGTLISPAEFIPIAEDSGLIERIGEMTLRRALEEVHNWPGNAYVSVNLSAVQFKSPTLPEMVRAAIEQTGMPAHRVELEVTEGLLLEDEQQVGSHIAALKALGVSVALDDFGTGYSSLGYLWKYQFDKLKIDRVFLEGYDYYSTKYRDIIATIVMLGHKMGMRVTVEGVEKQEQLDMLVALNCDQFQGFLLGRPMSARKAGALLVSTLEEPQDQAQSL